MLPQASSVDGVCHTSALYSWKMAWLTFGTNSDLMLWGDSKRECNVVITGATGQKKEHDRQLETRFQGSSLSGNKLMQNKLDLKYLFICVGKIRSKFTTGSRKLILSSWQCVASLMLEAPGTSPAPCGGKTSNICRPHQFRVLYCPNRHLLNIHFRTHRLLLRRGTLCCSCSVSPNNAINCKIASC